MLQDRVDTTTAQIPLRTHWVPRFLTSGVENWDLRDLWTRIDTWDSWCREWAAKAEIHEQLGEEALDQGRFATAGQALGRAAVYYHFAGFKFYNDMEQKWQVDRKAWECYRKAAPHLQPPAERINIPFDGTELVGYLRVPPGVSKPPCIINIAGMDSRKEEFQTLENEFLARGMATVSYDGPGQGEVWEKLKLRSDNERAAIAVLDYLESREEVDASRVGMYGWAFGGHYAPRAAAIDKRVRACVSMPVRYDLADWDTMGEANRITYRFLFGQVSNDEGKELASQFTLDGVLDKLTCPYLIIHGVQGDSVEEDEARKAADAAATGKLVTYEEGDHLCINIRYKSWPLMMDWFAEQLSA